MAGNIKGIVVEIGGNTGPLDKALQGVNKTSRDLQAELRQVERLLKLDPTNTELLSQKQKLLAESVENSKGKLDKLKEAEKQAQQQFKEGKISEEQYRALQREIISTEENLKSLEKQAGQSNVTLAKISTTAKEMGDKVTGVGKGMSVGITAPILAIGAASQAAWAEVDNALDTITTKTGATGEAAASLEQSFRNVASTIPTDLQTAGDAVGEVNTQFGILGKELDDATAKVVKFSSINGQDVSQTAIEAKGAIEAYGLSTQDLGLVLDSVTKSAQNTGVSTSELFNKVTLGAPQIKALGLDFSQATELVGRFEQKGLDSSKALSYLSKSQVIFAKDGKTLEQGLSALTEKIKNSNNETEALTIASKAFGAKGAVFMVDAIKRGALSLGDLKNASKNASGAVESTFEGILDPADKATVAMNNLKLAGADLGTTIQEALAPVLEKIVGWLQKFAEWFSGLSDESKTMIVVIGGILAAIGPLLIIIGQVISAVGAVAGVFSAASGAIAAAGGVMAIITGPIGIIIGIVAALIAVGVLLYKNWDTIKEVCITVWGIITDKVNQAIDFIKNLFNSFVDTVNTIVENIKNAFVDGWNAIVTFFTETIPKMIQDIIKWFEDLPRNLGLIIGRMIGTIIQFGIDVWKWITDDLPQIIVGIADWFKKLPGRIWDTLVEIITKFVQWHINTLTWVGTNLITIIDKIVGFFKELPGKVWDAIKDIINKLIDLKNNMIDWATTELPGFVSKFVSYIAELPGRMLNIGKDIVRGIWDGISGMAGWLWNKVTDFAKGIVDGIKGALKISSPSKLLADEVGKFMAQGIGIGFENEMDSVTNSMVKTLPTSKQDFELKAGNTGSTGYATANIYLDIEGRTLAKAVGEPLRDVIRVKTALAL